MEDILEEVKGLAKDGYRVIAVCDGVVKDTNEANIKDLDFLGMVAFIDPIREEVVDSINECNKAGIKVVMITGDNKDTAISIAKEVGLLENKDDILESSKIIEDSLDEFSIIILKSILPRSNCCARRARISISFSR